MALYPILADSIRAPHEDRSALPLWKKFICGGSAGGLASLTGVPSEVLLVRMTADQKLPASDPLRRNYGGILHALTRITKEEGAATLWSGAAPTVARAILLNAGQLAVFAQAKEQIRSRTDMDGPLLLFTSSLVASFFATFLSCPADVLKSRLQVGMDRVT